MLNDVVVTFINGGKRTIKNVKSFKLDITSNCFILNHYNNNNTFIPKEQVLLIGRVTDLLEA